MARFLRQNNLQGVRYFNKIFLLANISMEMIIGILFQLFINTNIKFVEYSGKLTQKSYTIIKGLLTT